MIMMSHSVNNKTRKGLVCLFKFKSFDQFNPSEPPHILDILNTAHYLSRVRGWKYLQKVI